MSWDGIYAKDRNYPIFEVGDEVFTTNDSWPRITPNTIITPFLREVKLKELGLD